MAKDKLLKATHQGKIPIGDVELPCFVLEDGRRVISGRGMTKAIGMKGRGQGVSRISAHKTLKPYINNDLDLAIANPIQFIGAGSRKKNPTAGYEATILHDLCQAVLDARDYGALKTEQELRYAQYCDMLIRAFAKVGIVALVDEATGYQAVEERQKLHELLAIYLSEEKLKWARTFPDEFYRQIYKLKKWQYPTGSTKRTPLIGKITNEIVYDRLPPGVLGELKKRNPIVPETKRRKWKHFQFLSEDIGQPDLRDHLLQLIAVMRSASNWNVFKRLFERAFPRPGDQLTLSYEEPED